MLRPRDRINVLSASAWNVNASLTDSRQDGLIERVARIADEHPEHGEMRRGIRAEDRVVDDQQRLGSAVERDTGRRIERNRVSGRALISRKLRSIRRQRRDLI